VPQVFANNAFSVINGAISDSATTINLTPSTGVRFPALGGGDFFLATLFSIDGSGNESAWEIVKCTARSGDVLTVERGQENTAGAAWLSGTRIELRPTASLGAFAVAAYGWGDHAGAGYLTSYTVTQLDVTAHQAALSITESQISDFGSYLTSESDPVFTGHAAYGITGTQITNWNTAYGWGDHASAGYQSALVSGTNIKTVNGSSLLGGGNLVIAAGGTSEMAYRDRATDAQICGFTGDAGVTSERLASAAGPVTISGTTNISLDWGTFVSGTCQLTGNRSLSLYNVMPGTYKEILFYGNTSSTRTLTFSGSNWKGDLPAVAVTSSVKCLVGIRIVSATEWLVSAVEY